MCGHSELYGHHGHSGCCCQPGGSEGHPAHRRFPSREERITRLEEQLNELRAEAKAVEERLAEIKAAG